MNTYRIYEEFRASLGEAAAKSLAQTLGAMFEELKDTATKEDFRILRESIDGNVSRIDTALANLAEAQGRTEIRVEELAEAQKRTEIRVEELAEAQKRTEIRVDELTVAVKELAEAQKRTESVLQRLSIRVDTVVGRTLELQFRDRLTSYLGLFLRRGKLIAAADLLDEIEPKLERTEVEDFLRTDAVASGLVAGNPSYVVAEVSATADADDILRAARRAACLQKAGLAAVPLVACETISPETMAFAKERAVRVWLDGRLIEEAA